MEQIEQAVMMPMGEQILLPAGWNIDDWSVTLRGDGLTSNGVVAMETGPREVTISPGEFYADGLTWPSACPTAAFCAETDASSPGLVEHQTTTTTVGDVTYHKVSSAVRTHWYLDHQGRVYRFAQTSRTPAANQFETEMIMSADWSGTRGTAICLPTGVCLGLDMAAEWTVTADLRLTPPGGSRSDDSVGVFLTVGGARFGLEENTGSEEVEATPIGEQTVGGITYHGTTWTPYDPALGPDFQTWDFTHYGHVFRLYGSTSSMSAFMESVGWNKTTFKMELDHLEQFKNWLQELSDIVQARADSTQGPSVIKHIDENMQTAGIREGHSFRPGPIAAIREAIKSLFRQYETAFAESSAEIQRIIDRTLDENQRGLTHLQRIQQDTEHRNNYGPITLLASNTPPDLRGRHPVKTVWKVDVGAALHLVGKRECQWDGEDLTIPHLYKSSAPAIHNDPGLALNPIEEPKTVSAAPEWLSVLSTTTWVNAGISQVFGVDLLDRLGREVVGDWGKLRKIARCLHQLSAYSQRYYESLDKALSYVFNGWKGYEAETACALFLRNLVIIDAHRELFDETAEAFDEIAYAVEQDADVVKSGVTFGVDWYIPLPHKLLTIASGILGAGDVAIQTSESLATEKPDLDRVYSRMIYLPAPIAYDNPMV